jgi:nitric oxide reductase subunit B
MLFCIQHLITKEAWNPVLVRRAFWALNGGMMLMMFLDLFPVGLYQCMIVVQEGLWFARSQEILTGGIWKTLTYFRSVGGTLFIVGGVLPLIVFFIKGGRSLRAETEDTGEGEWTVYEKDWAA